MKMKVQPNNQKLKKDLEKKLNEIQKQEQKDNADAIRDELDGPWAALTEPQRKAAQEISAAINKTLSRIRGF